MPKTGKKKKSTKLTRRDFLKNTCTTGAALGVAALAPSLAGKAFAARRDHILIGRPLPFSGPLAGFTEAEKWITARALKEINKDGGIYIKEYGKKVPLRIKFLDTVSDPSKAAELTSRLVLKDKVDMISTSDSPLTVNPVAAACEKFEMPCLCTIVPVEIFLAGGPYKWSFMPCCSLKDFMASFLEMWSQVENNKVVGLLAENDPDGIGWAKAASAALPKAGYKVMDVGRIPRGTMDYTNTIAEWKKANVDILFGNMSTPDFARIWRQCFRIGFLPKIATIGKALLFPSAVESIGKDLGMGVSCEIWWHPVFGFKSSLAGYSAQDLCDAYTAETGRQWSPPVGHIYLSYEILADVLKRAQSLDKEVLRKALADTDLDTIGGHVKFAENNSAVTPSGGMQWVKGKKFPFKYGLVSRGNFADLPTEGKLQPLSVFHK